MAKIKFDNELASLVKSDLDRLNSEIAEYLDAIADSKERISPTSSKVTVYKTKTETTTSVVNGETVTTSKQVTYATYPYTSNVNAYNGAVSAMSSKAKLLKTTTNLRIKKVTNALAKVISLINDFEANSIQMSSKLGDLADYDFSFLNGYSSGTNGLNGVENVGLGTPSYVSMKNDEFLSYDWSAMLGSDSKFNDAEGDGSIDTYDVYNTFLQENTNENGEVIYNGENLGKLDESDLETILANPVTAGALVGYFNENIVDENSKVSMVVSEENSEQKDISFVISKNEEPAYFQEDLHPGEETDGTEDGSVPDDFGEDGESEEDNITDETTTGEDDSIPGEEGEVDSELENSKEADSVVIENSEKSQEENVATGEMVEKEDINNVVGKIEENDKGDEPKTESMTNPVRNEPVIEPETRPSDNGKNQGSNGNGLSSSGKSKVQETNSNTPKNNTVVKPEEGVNNNTNRGNESSNRVNENSNRVQKPIVSNKPVRDERKIEVPSTTPTIREEPKEAEISDSKKVVQVATQKDTASEKAPQINIRDESSTSIIKDKLDLPKSKDDLIELPVVEKEVSASSALAGAAGIGVTTVLGGGGSSVPDIPMDSVLGESNAGIIGNDAMMSVPTQSSVSTLPSTAGDLNEPVRTQESIVNQNASNDTVSSQSGNSSSVGKEETLSKGKSNYNGNASTSSGTKTKDSTSKKQSNSSEEEFDTSAPEGVLGEASYAELIVKEEKQIKVATGMSASSMIISVALSFAGAIEVIVLVLLLMAIGVAYATFRDQKKKKIKKLKDLIKIEKIDKEEKTEIEESTEEVSSTDATTETSESNEVSEEETNVAVEDVSAKVESEEESHIQASQKVENFPIEQKEFQSAEEVIYGEMPTRNTNDETISEEEKSE